MDVIILAGGRGARMAPLTDNTPKPMLQVLGKNLIEWKLEALPLGVSHIILVVGYKKEIIMDHFGDSWRGVPITYVEQKVLDGTGGAMILCKDFVGDKTLVLMGDDIYKKEDLEKLATHDYAMLVIDEGEEGLKKKGQVIVRDGLLAGINEGDSQTGVTSSLINCAAYVVSKKYFSYQPVQFSETEYGLPHTLVAHLDETPVHIELASWWIQITTPECLDRADKILSAN